MDSIFFITEFTKISITPSSHLNFEIPTVSTQNIYSLVYSFNQYYMLGFILGSGDKIENAINTSFNLLELLFMNN